VRQLIFQGKNLLLLGGGNDISYPDVKGFFEALSGKGIVALNIDAHLDVRKSRRCHSGTPYRQLIEEKILHAGNFFECGIQKSVNSKVYLSYVHENNIPVFFLEDVKGKNWELFFKDVLPEGPPLFCGFDMDVIKMSESPGVSAPSPCGLSSEEAFSLAAFMGKIKNCRIFEITELNPIYDLDQRSARLAAVMLHAFLEAFGRR
jgi:arginase family enzyme